MAGLVTEMIEVPGRSDEDVDGMFPMAAESSQNSMYPVPRRMTLCSKKALDFSIRVIDVLHMVVKRKLFTGNCGILSWRSWGDFVAVLGH